MTINICGKEYYSSEIDYVGIKRVKAENPIYSIVVSANKQEENIAETSTIDEIKICEIYKQIYKELCQDGSFFAPNKFAPIINIKRAKNIELKQSKFLSYNHYLNVELYNGAIFKSKPLPYKNGVSKYEYIYFLFCSSKNDQLCR